VSRAPHARSTRAPDAPEPYPTLARRRAQTIIDTNNLVRKALEGGQPANVIVEHWDFLQVQCAMYINSDLPGLPMAYQSTSKPLRRAPRPARALPALCVSFGSAPDEGPEPGGTTQSSSRCAAC